MWLEQREKTQQQEKIDDLTKEQKREINKALNTSSKTSRSDWRNGARDLYRQGKLPHDAAKRIIDMMKTYY